MAEDIIEKSVEIDHADNSVEYGHVEKDGSSIKKSTFKSEILELLEKIEDFFEGEGLARRIIILSVSALSVILSFVLKNNYIAFLAIILCGIPIVVEAIEGLLESFNIKTDLLVAIALIGSIIIGAFFAAAEIGFIMGLGEFLEELTVEKAKKGIEKIVSLKPLIAHKITAGKEETVKVESILIGDLIRVYPGERIPVDGVIVKGQTAIDASVITGESVPVDKIEGDSVLSGTINTYGSFDFRVTKLSEDSAIQRMITLVESTDASKAKAVRLADKWATWIVLVAFLSAVFAYFFTGDIIRSVTVLVVFCPCSLVLATPTAIMAAVSNISHRGILVQNIEALERMSAVEKISFDKTGTLTLGKMRVLEIKSVNSAYDDNEFFALVASLEALSEHPIGKTIKEDYIAKHGLNAFRPVENFKTITGVGLCGVVDGKVVGAGRKTSDGGTAASSRGKTLDGGTAASSRGKTSDGGTAASSRGKITDIASAENADNFFYQRYLDDGNTVVLVEIDGVLSGFVVLADTIRDTAKITIEEVKNTGVVPVLLTGDNEKVAGRVAKEVGITEVIPNCLPEDKLQYVSEGNSKICMIGDGVNDAPSLKGAFVGISMGLGGSDIALEASDIVLIKDNIEDLPHLIRLSRRMLRSIKMNITFAMTVNFVAIVLAMYGQIGPVAGALVHNGGSLLVVLNSLFLMGVGKKGRKGSVR